MKSGDLLKLEELDARTVPSATTLPPVFAGSFGPTSSFTASAFPAATSALSSTGGFTSSLVSSGPSIGSGILNTPSANVLASTGGFASSIVPVGPSIASGILNIPSASSILPVTTPNTHTVSSALPVGAGFFPTTPTPHNTHPTPSVPVPTIHLQNPPITNPIVTTKTSNPTGIAQGTFTHPDTPGDLNVNEVTTYRLKGTGHLARFGSVNVTGTLHSVGFVSSGHATGELTLSNNSGSITLQLLGPTQSGLSPLPETFNYTVVAQTGDLVESLANQGTLTLLTQSTGTSFLASGPGTFTLTIP